MKGKRGKAGKTKELPRWAKILIVAILAILLVVTDWLVKGHFEPAIAITVSAVLIFLILRIRFQSIKRAVQRVLNLIGEDRGNIIRPAWHFPLVSFMILVLVFYILLGDSRALLDESRVIVPPVLQFNIIIVSAALGGLVLAGATNKRLSDSVHDELIFVAQKLIVATILFVFSTALLFFSELTTTIDWLYNACFWLTALCFFPGVILFALGIIDLIIALSHMRQRPDT